VSEIAEENSLALKAILRAHTDALSIGVGFLVIKRKATRGLEMRYCPWPDVHKYLEDIGAAGPLGGRED
jgi:hypothetical protein